MRAGSVFIDSIPLDEALRKWFDFLEVKGILNVFHGEAIDVAASLDRITAEPVTALLSSPFFHSSAMDGYAIRFDATFGASETTPVRLRIPDDALYLNTGEPIPDGFNAVIMIEDVNVIKDAAAGREDIEIIKAAAPYQHIRVIGEDIVATELILPENHKIRAIDIGAALAGGHTHINVRKRPSVAVIPTGSEIVAPGVPLTKGRIIDSNSAMIAGLINGYGSSAACYPIVKDNLDEIKCVVSEAVKSHDLVLIIAGSSAGSRDYTSTVIRDLGQCILHGVNIKPGRPLILGMIDGSAVAGIPGYPVSAYITVDLFIKPLIHKWLGLSSEQPETITAVIGRTISSAIGQEEFIRVKVGKVGDRFVATPLGRGAGIMMSLVRADAMLTIPAMSEGVGAASEVNVRLMRPKSDILDTIVCIGSHDNTLDVLYNFLKRKYPRYSLSSAHVGSMGGIIAIKKHEAHIAGTHLLDEKTGLYNIPFIEKYLPDERVMLVNLVYRQQGFIVRQGNPKNITTIDDLQRADIIFINRQLGTGTRLLTDKCLRDLGISGRTIKGYDTIEYTHMAVASAVASGRADTGMGILTAAIALGLDFVPVAKERYDFVLTRDSYAIPMVEALFDIIRNDEEFRLTTLRMGGYDVSDMGKVMYST
ncbi:MAG: molybdopterin biosynthesis protein [Nitrospirae bacterium]|nr:molybdopterin biosynthesis protein [Nitrospirota bacterium]